jgi:DNA-binding MarR family transcriptional regulator
MKKNTTDPLKLSWKEIGVLAQGLAFASRPLKGAIDGVTAKYQLGPRGGWILRLIESRQVTHPLDVTNFFHISRSVISEELALLTDRGLIVYRQSKKDGRRVELALTQGGKKVSLRVRQEITKLITERFSAYSRDDVLKMCRMLHEYLFGEPAGADSGVKAAKTKSTRRRRAVVLSQDGL